MDDITGIKEAAHALVQEIERGGNRCDRIAYQSAAVRRSKRQRIV